MKISITILFLLMFNAFTVKADQTCQYREDFLGAHYLLTNTQLASSQLVNSKIDSNQENAIKNKMIHTSSLWRKPNKVLSVNGERSTTWFKANHGLVQKTMHFDHFQRSIEYQAKAMSESHWQQIRQLIPNSKKQSLTLVNTIKDSCYQQALYKWQDKATNLKGKLLWNKDLNLITELTIVQGKQKSHWRLEAIEHDKEVIELTFSQRANYQSTDFADIGDNESDPFLIKMINLGFIEHGSSGIYNANGESMPIQHNH